MPATRTTITSTITRTHADQGKRRFAAELRNRFFLRLFWIVTGTILGGLLATRLMLFFEVSNLAVRYFLAVSLAYLVFLLLIRIWLWYVRIESGPDVTEGIDAAEIALDGADLGSVVDGPSGCLDVDEGVIGFVFAVVMLGLLIAGLYVIYLAPAILTEVAFEAALAAALVRRARRIDRPGWVGKVWRVTLWPFVIVLVSATLLGFLAQQTCPEATRMREVVHCIRTAPI
jgi:hypothetical protein